MAKRQSHSLTKKLSKKLRLLEQKEEQGRRKLRKVMTQLNQMGQRYQAKLAASMHSLKTKFGKAHASTYLKAAADLEKHASSFISKFIDKVLNEKPTRAKKASKTSKSLRKKTAKVAKASKPKKSKRSKRVRALH